MSVETVRCVHTLGDISDSLLTNSGERSKVTVTDRLLLHQADQPM